MVGDILRSVTDCENEAQKIIAEAKDQAVAIKNGAKDDIKQKKTLEAVSFKNAADKKREAVKEEEERKDKEFTLKVGEELEAIEAAASKEEERIISELAKRVYAI